MTVNLTNGEFDGYAWAEGIGWVHLRNATPTYGVAMSTSGTVIRFR